MLTRKQHELLVFIHQRLKDSGVSPSFDEMKEALDLRSKSGIHRLISGLEERGFIRRLAHRARALEVLRLPENSGMPGAAGAESLPQVSLERPMTLPRPANASDRPRTPPRSSGFSPKVIKGDFRAAFPGVAPGGEDVAAVALPLYGRIAAGTPIEALRDPSSTIDIPVSLLSGDAEHYALEVAGDSMIDAGILDGDTVIVRRCDTAENGTIIVALVDDAEVTLKRLRRKGASIALEPANQSHETRIFGPDRVKVQGRMIGLFRRY